MAYFFYQPNYQQAGEDSYNEQFRALELQSLNLNFKLEHFPNLKSDVERFSKDQETCTGSLLNHWQKLGSLILWP